MNSNVVIRVVAVLIAAVLAAIFALSLTATSARPMSDSPWDGVQVPCSTCV